MVIVLHLIVLFETICAILVIIASASVVGLGLVGSSGPRITCTLYRFLDFLCLLFRIDGVNKS